ncbi:helix-turn-helix domain-containing protein [Kutzneria viridogrisea]|uniref:Helix-turn-helix domain-containing protein n=2 Tax=Kutzneria TaxID=43356 RepID=W5WF17_9PSEU|nr:helix-turn-helix domain-containing protein [Kutzneria albida]AHH96754.1 hypothetical protein KALB_3387 [Kutzneria albida DSM 43870]MBA8928027.1 excisionase family DNA binding protein [Kutzneria viridogrisea]
MSQELYSVEQVAEQLGLHVRTVRNYVREGRLKAVRIGKQYRIAAEDLAAFTGQPDRPLRTQRHTDVSSVVQIEGIDATKAARVAAMVLGWAKTRDQGDQPMRIDTMHDPNRDCLKIVVLGGLSSSAEVLRLITELVEGKP